MCGQEITRATSSDPSTQNRRHSFLSALLFHLFCSFFIVCELDSHVELCICFQPDKNMNAKKIKKENMETQNREATNISSKEQTSIKK